MVLMRRILGKVAKFEFISESPPITAASLEIKADKLWPSPQKGDMSNKNSAGCDSSNECDYSESCEESSFKDLIDSHSERDLCLCCQQNFSCTSFEKRSNLSEIVQISGNDQTSFTNFCKNRPAAQVQKLENTRDFQVELSPGSVLHFTFEGYPKSDYPLRTYSCDGSCQDTLCLNSGIPHLIFTEESVKQPTVCTVKELCRNQPPSDCLITSSPKKSLQVSFPCTETEVSENTEDECFKQSVCDEVNQTPVKKLITRHKYHESICDKNKTSSQLITEVSDYSSETLDKADSPQTPECICSCSISGDLIISLTLEAAYPTNSLGGNITISEVKVGTGASTKCALTFNSKDLKQKLYVSVISSSAHLNTESLKQTVPCTKQTGLLKILVDEASQSLPAQTESSEFSSLDFYPGQVASTLKPQAPSKSCLCSKHRHVTQYPLFFVRSFPRHKVISADKISEVQKSQLKTFRPPKSIVFPKNKVREDKKIRNKSRLSKFNWHTTWDAESINQNTHHLYKTVQELEINELYYVPQISTCCCSPLLDLSSELNSKWPYSGTEKPLGIHRKLHKRTRGAKVMPRFSSHYLLNPRSCLERLYYISPTRKKNHLKMQNILNHCFSCAGGQNRHESCKEEVRPIVYSLNTRENGLFTPPLSTDVSSTVPLLSSSGNSPIPLPRAGSVPHENRHSPVPCLQKPAALCFLPNERWPSPASSAQTEREPYPVELHSLPSERRSSPASCLQAEKENWHHADGQGSRSPCANVVSVVKPPKKRNVFNTKEVDSEAACVTCGDLGLKKLSVCPCGSMPQYGLFPNGDVSQSVSAKPRKSPDINQRTSLTKSDTVSSPRGTFNTMESCCSKYHHLFPSRSLHNRQGILRSQFTKAQSYFEDGSSIKNLKEDTLQECKEVKSSERKHVSIYPEPDIPQRTGPLSPNDGYNVSKYAVYEPKCCSCCSTIVKQLHSTSREASTSFSSKHKLQENCLNRQQVFLAEPCKWNRTWCTCSREIPLFCIDQADMYEKNRAVLPKTIDSENTQVSSIRFITAGKGMIKVISAAKTKFSAIVYK